MVFMLSFPAFGSAALVRPGPWRHDGVARATCREPLAWQVQWEPAAPSTIPMSDPSRCWLGRSRTDRSWSGPVVVLGPVLPTRFGTADWGLPACAGEAPSGLPKNGRPSGQRRGGLVSPTPRNAEEPDPKEAFPPGRSVQDCHRNKA